MNAGGAGAPALWACVVRPVRAGGARKTVRRRCGEEQIRPGRAAARVGAGGRLQHVQLVAELVALGMQRAQILFEKRLVRGIALLRFLPLLLSFVPERFDFCESFLELGFLLL